MGQAYISNGLGVAM